MRWIPSPRIAVLVIASWSAAPGCVGHIPGTDADGQLGGPPPSGAPVMRPRGGSPVLRGLLIRQSLLCQTPPPPPPDVQTSVPPPAPTASTRERFLQHRQNPSCAGCH